MGLGIRVTDTALTAIPVTDTVTDMGIIRMDTIGHIRPIPTTGAPRTIGLTAIGFTATTGIITTDTDK